VHGDFPLSICSMNIHDFIVIQYKDNLHLN
jgi:hypothetical protein